MKKYFFTILISLFIFLIFFLNCSINTFNPQPLVRQGASKDLLQQKTGIRKFLQKKTVFKDPMYSWKVPKEKWKSNQAKNVVEFKNASTQTRSIVLVLNPIDR